MVAINKQAVKEDTFIVKLQRPLFSSATTENPVLSYNRSRTVHKYLPLTEELKKLFGHEYKIYCNARLTQGDVLEILDITKDQPW